MSSYWLAKRLSVSYKTPYLKWWIVKRNADKNGRANVLLFNEDDLVLLSTVNLPRHVVTNVGSDKLLPKFIGPFRVLHRRGNAYTIELPRKMRTHPMFYVGRYRPYHEFGVCSGEEFPCTRKSLRGSCASNAENQHAPEARIYPRGAEKYPIELHLAFRERKRCARPFSSWSKAN